MGGVPEGLGEVPEVIGEVLWPLGELPWPLGEVPCPLGELPEPMDLLLRALSLLPVLALVLLGRLGCRLLDLTGRLPGLPAPRAEAERQDGPAVRRLHVEDEEVRDLGVGDAAELLGSE